MIDPKQLNQIHTAKPRRCYRDVKYDKAYLAFEVDGGIEGVHAGAGASGFTREEIQYFRRKHKWEDARKSRIALLLSKNEQTGEEALTDDAKLMAEAIVENHKLNKAIVTLTHAQLPNFERVLNVLSKTALDESNALKDKVYAAVSYGNLFVKLIPKMELHAASNSDPANCVGTLFFAPPAVVSAQIPPKPKKTRLGPNMKKTTPKK